MYLLTFDLLCKHETCPKTLSNLMLFAALYYTTVITTLVLCSILSHQALLPRWYVSLSSGQLLCINYKYVHMLNSYAPNIINYDCTNLGLGVEVGPSLNQ